MASARLAKEAIDTGALFYIYDWRRQMLALRGGLPWVHEPDQQQRNWNWRQANLVPAQIDMPGRDFSSEYFD